MGKIGIKNQTAPATPSSGYTEVYVDSADKHLKQKDDAGTVTDLTEATGAVPLSTVTAAGDLIIATGSGAVTKLAKPTGSSGDGDQVLTWTDNDGDVEWTKHQGNAADLRYVTTQTTDVLYASDHVLVATYASGDSTFSFTEPNDYFATTGRGKLFAFKNATSDQILIVKLDGTSTFQNGLNEVKVYPRSVLRMGVVRANVADGYFLMQDLRADIQCSRSTAWNATNFATAAAIPFDTNDSVYDSNIIDHSTSTNTERIVFGCKGQVEVSFQFYVNSTGGSTYNINAYLRKNGTTTVQGSLTTGNYGGEDQSMHSGPIRLDVDVDDYFEVMVDHTSLTGEIDDILVFAKGVF